MRECNPSDNALEGQAEARLRPLSTRKFNLLLKLIKRYEREARRCAKAKSYYGACALIGAALEGSLLAMCAIYPNEVVDAIARLPPDKRPKGKLMDKWTLGPLAFVASEAGWLPARRHKRARTMVGDWVHLVQELRNMVHPGMHVREYPTTRVRKGNYADARWVFEEVNTWLYSRVVDNLRREMRSKGILLEE